MFKIQLGCGVSSFGFKIYEWNDYNRDAPDFMVFPFEHGGKGSISTNNPVWQHDHGNQRLMINWSAGGPAGSVSWAARGTCTGPYSSSHTLIANRVGEKFYLVDWTSVLKKHQEIELGIYDPKDLDSAPADNTALLVAAALIGGLATGVAALGPKGALPSGLILSLGGLALMAFDSQEPPPPPNIDQIKSAVEKVIKKELQNNNATELAVDLLSTTVKFVELVRLVKSEANDSGSGTFYEEQLRIFINEQFRATDDGSLNNSMTYLNTEVDVCRLILPTYATGIAVHLHLRRLHALDAAMKDSPVTGEVVSVFYDEVVKCRQGLEAALIAYKQLCDEIISSDHLVGLQEAEIIRSILHRIYLGSDTPDTLEVMASNLRNMETALQADIAGPITHFFNLAWLNQA